MVTSEEQKQVDPVKELTEYIQDFCSKNGLQCFSVILLKNQENTNIGCILSGKPKDLVPALNEVMERDEHATRFITEVYQYAKIKQMLTESGNPAELFKVMMS